jgi:two-component system LytT family sensor kinase
MEEKAMNQESSWNRGVKKWLAIFGIWTLFALFFTSQSFLQQQLFPNPPSFWKILSWQLASGWIWFAFMPVILWLIKKFPLDNANWWTNIPLHLVFSILISLGQLSIDAYLLPMLGYTPGGPFTSYWHAYKVFLMINIHFGIGIYWGALGINHTIKYYQKYQERELKTSQLEARLAQSRLQVLKFQLQPHFLFNTLNTISELIYRDPESAERMITDLSDLLRLSLEKLEVQEVSLQQELDFLNKYVEIEQIRFHDRLKIEMNVAPETLDAQVPNMILQPLVENAIKHGISPLSQGGTIKVGAERRNGSLLLSVSDNGVGLTNLDISAIPEGVGLKNTKSRLRHLYGEKHKFEIHPEKKGLTLNLTIPYKNYNEN